MSTPWESHRDPSSSEPASGSAPKDAPTPYSAPAPYEDPSGLAPYSDPYSSGSSPSEPYSSGAYGPSPYGSSPYTSGQYGSGPYSSGQYSSGPYGAGPPAAGPYGATPYGPGPYGQTYPPSRPVSGLAIAALVCGIVGFFTAGLASIPAVICGHMAWRETSGGSHSGHGMAIAGLVLGYLQILGWALFWLILIGSVAST